MRSFPFFAAAMACSINGCATFSAGACGFIMMHASLPEPLYLKELNRFGNGIATE
jgi:hypothetical protein